MSLERTRQEERPLLGVNPTSSRPRLPGLLESPPRLIASRINQLISTVLYPRSAPPLPLLPPLPLDRADQKEPPLDQVQQRPQRLQLLQ